MKCRGEFSYWKYPWGKYAVIAAALLQTLLLFYNIHEYNTVMTLDIYSISELEKYAVQQKSVCMLNALVVLALGWIFLTGVFLHCKKSAKLSEIVLLFLLAAMIAVWTLVFHKYIREIWIFAVLFAITLTVGIYAFYRYRNDNYL